MATFYVMNANTLAAKQAVASAGLGGVYIAANWASLQPNGAGSALNSSAIAALNQEIADARSLGLGICFSHSPQYSPNWVKSSVEPFKDQNGDEYLSTDSGKQVRNWFWTANGRQYIADFYTKVWQGLTPENRMAVTYLKFGGGYYGEIQYPPEVGSSPDWLYRGFGNSMQTGVGLAPGLTACPEPGYVPFTGSDSQDVAWINWFLGGIEDFVRWQIDLLKSLGWTCPLFAMHPGYSVRNNTGRSNSGWRQNFAIGVDFTRMMGIYKNDPQVWPWSTWLGGYDGWTPNTFDSDQAAWKKLYATAAAHGKHYNIGGENTGGETNSDLDAILDSALGATPPSTTGPIYSDGRPQTAWSGYKHIMWLDYASLTAGGSNATLAHYGQKAAAV